MAIVAYILFFIPLLTDAKNDPFVKYHVKQGLVLFIYFAIAWIVVNVIPVVGWVLYPVLEIIGIVLLVLGILNAINGKEKPLPVIGKYAEKFNF